MVNSSSANQGNAWAHGCAQRIVFGWHRQTCLTVLFRLAASIRVSMGKRVCPCHPLLGRLALNRSSFDYGSLRSRECIEIYGNSETDASLPVLVARIEPFARVANQASPDRILVNVLDGLIDGRYRRHIPIIPAAHLPEVIRRLLLGGGQPLQSLRPVPSEIDQCSARHWLLDGTQDFGDRIRLPSRTNQKMDVLRHKDVCPDVKCMLYLRGDNCVHQVVAGAFALQEGAIMKTTESQLMGVAGKVITMTPLAIRLSKSPCDHHIDECTVKQVWRCHPANGRLRAKHLQAWT
jgi:hypothetical protein